MGFGSTGCSLSRAHLHREWMIHIPKTNDTWVTFTLISEMKGFVHWEFRNIIVWDCVYFFWNYKRWRAKHNEKQPYHPVTFIQKYLEEEINRLVLMRTSRRDIQWDQIWLKSVVCDHATSQMQPCLETGSDFTKHHDLIWRHYANDKYSKIEEGDPYNVHGRTVTQTTTVNTSSA